MYLTRLQLKNFRGFKALDLPLPNQLTLLVGRNASGKTSILKAIDAVTTHLNVLSHRTTEEQLRLSPLDVHNGAAEAQIIATWSHPAYSIGVSRGRDRRQPPNTLWTTAPSPQLTQGPLAQTHSFPKPPLCILYGVDRARLRPDPKPPANTENIYVAIGPNPEIRDTTLPLALPFQRFIEWFEDRENLENQNIRTALNNLSPQDLENQNIRTIQGWYTLDSALTHVRQAVASILGTEYGQPRIDRTHSVQLVIEKAGTTSTSGMAAQRPAQAVPDVSEGPVRRIYALSCGRIRHPRECRSACAAGFPLLSRAPAAPWS